jgi:hypothetical protein
MRNKKQNVENTVLCQAEAKGSTHYFPGLRLEAAASIETLSYFVKNIFLRMNL